MTPLPRSRFANIGRSQEVGRVLLLAGLGVPALCWLFSVTGCSKVRPEEPTVSVETASVEKQTLERTVTAEAILFPLQQSALVPKVSAPVKAFYVKRGSRVRKGQLLAVLENRDLAAAAQENKGAYNQAEAAYETTTAASLPEEIQKAKLDADVAKETLDATQKVYDSRQELYKQGALPRKDLDQASVNLVQARSQYDIAEKHLNSLMAVGKQQELKSAAGQLESAKGKYLGAQAQLSYSEIRSPIDGVVTDRPLYPGEMAAVGTPLITVMDISQVIARAHIPQDQAALLKIGDKATITVTGTDKPVAAKVTVVSPALDPNSTTVEVWIQAKNPGQQMRPGASVQVSMLSHTVPDALVVPASAILTAPDGGTSVMVVGSDNRAHQKAVKTGIKHVDDIQIVEGVAEGEEVVASGAYGLPDNTKVTVERGKQSSQLPEKPPGKEKEKEKEKDER
ncbi:MAG: efflux RND transporter periplasmic adaptor subunit [Acidobacteria bacterium]|nr:MAG: efflux RND transporter periplasmic adaptor subunit [Acidobacteriota bacterium]